VRRHKAQNGLRTEPNLITLHHLGCILEREASEEDLRARGKGNIFTLCSPYQHVNCGELLRGSARWTHPELGNTETEVWEVIINRGDGSR